MQIHTHTHPSCTQRNTCKCVYSLQAYNNNNNVATALAVEVLKAHKAVAAAKSTGTQKFTQTHIQSSLHIFICMCCVSMPVCLLRAASKLGVAYPGKHAFTHTGAQGNGGRGRIFVDTCVCVCLSAHIARRRNKSKSTRTHADKAIARPDSHWKDALLAFVNVVAVVVFFVIVVCVAGALSVAVLCDGILKHRVCNVCLVLDVKRRHWQGHTLHPYSYPPVNQPAY